MAELVKLTTGVIDSVFIAKDHETLTTPQLWYARIERDTGPIFVVAALNSIDLAEFRQRVITEYEQPYDFGYLDLLGVNILTVSKLPEGEMNDLEALRSEDLIEQMHDHALSARRDTQQAGAPLLERQLSEILEIARKVDLLHYLNHLRSRRSHSHY